MKILNNSLDEVGFETSDIIIIALLILGIISAITITFLSLFVILPIVAILIIILIKEKLLNNDKK